MSTTRTIESADTNAEGNQLILGFRSIIIELIKGSLTNVGVVWRAV